MKAIIRTRYGSPDVLQLQEVEKPVPKDDEVVVQVHAASVNTLDWHVMRGQPFLAPRRRQWAPQAQGPATRRGSGRAGGGSGRQRHPISGRGRCLWDWAWGLCRICVC